MLRRSLLSLVDGPGGRGGRLGLGLLDLSKFVDMSMTVLNSRRLDLIDVATMVVGGSRKNALMFMIQ